MVYHGPGHDDRHSKFRRGPPLQPKETHAPAARRAFEASRGENAAGLQRRVAGLGLGQHWKPTEQLQAASQLGLLQILAFSPLRLSPSLAVLLGIRDRAIKLCSTAPSFWQSTTALKAKRECGVLYGILTGRVQPSTLQASHVTHLPSLRALQSRERPVGRSGHTRQAVLERLPRGLGKQKADVARRCARCLCPKHNVTRSVDRRSCADRLARGA